ncbi:MAG: YhbY family RNA-binding protein [Euryarchaeota archaeon]|nr:YhbY family RNA-binding protein [Euryarchaeota archaeon]
MNIDATIRVGKNGLTEGVIEEIRAQLKNRKIVKIKFLKNSEREDMKALAERIAGEVGGTVVDVRGFTITIEKKR